jgi:hypothetical protein
MLTVPSPPVVTSGVLVSSGRRSFMLGKLHVSVVGLPTAAKGHSSKHTCLSWSRDVFQTSTSHMLDAQV